MSLFRPWPGVVTALAMVTAGSGPAVAVQPGHAPATAPTHFERHAYPSALNAFANYQSCGSHARAREIEALGLALRTGEAEARASGLGAELERLKREYLALLAVSSTVACAGGPAAALAGARVAMRAFAAWVAAATGDAEANN